MRRRVSNYLTYLSLAWYRELCQFVRRHLPMTDPPIEVLRELFVAQLVRDVIRLQHSPICIRIWPSEVR